jgi:hypothetical protein
VIFFWKGGNYMVSYVWPNSYEVTPFLILFQSQIKSRWSLPPLSIISIPGWPCCAEGIVKQKDEERRKWGERLGVEVVVVVDFDVWTRKSSP